jgi:hypothetical protein
MATLITILYGQNIIDFYIRHILWKVNGGTNTVMQINLPIDILLLK